MGYVFGHDVLSEKLRYKEGEYGIRSTDRSLPGRIFPTPRCAQIRTRSSGEVCNTIRLEVMDNRAEGSTTDTWERFEYRLTDNFVGWKRYELPWSAFTRRTDWQPAGAPNDGFTRTGVGGYNFAPISGSGSFQVDQVELRR